MKATSPSSAARIHRRLVWLFVFCFNLAAYFADDVALQTKSSVSANCGETVSLTCSATAQQPWDIEIKKFSLQLKNKMCEYGKNTTEGEFRCGSTNTTFSRTITLTLKSVMPADDGDYLCKLHSTKGSWNNRSQLRIQGCLGETKTSRNNSYVECLFEGVYPSGVVHWFQENENLTEVASVKETKDEHNRFNIRSAIKLREGNLSEPYTCSLWIPSLSRYLTTQQNSGRYPTSQQNSGSYPTTQKNSGCLIKHPQWICVVVMVMMSLLM